MDGVRATAGGLLGALVLAEGGAFAWRLAERRRVYGAALARARDTGRQLVVVGSPDAGTQGAIARVYGCGDLCLDLGGCNRCPTQLVADITQRIDGLADDSSVVFVSCVLEYVNDPQAAWREVLRIAGRPENVFLVDVQGWTAAAALYPGAEWRVSRDGVQISARAVPVWQKIAWLAGLAGLVTVAVWPEPGL